MECAYAEHLRNVALVSISRELRVHDRKRVAALHPKNVAVDSQALLSLRQKTDEHRKALRDHLTNCPRCQSAR
jgi:hypothetical protein